MKLIAVFVFLAVASMAGAATTASNIKPWPRAEMGYYIEPEFPAELRERIHAAVAQINAVHIVTLTEINDQQLPAWGREFSSFTYKANKSVCSSGYGWEYEQNNMIRISDDCTTGTIVHEILHALGFMHEQVNPHRTMDLILDRIQGYIEDQSSNANAVALTEYDPDSIMHYSSFATSICNYLEDSKWEMPLARLPDRSCRVDGWEKLTAANNNGKDCHQECAVFITKEGKYVSGQRVGLSPLDIEGLRQLYGVK
ncbi:M12 family metallopeptidase [Bdellovibrio sp. HCB288]|uniref:M12 family metallopeptidase n=1 Tax=Bdellovibrio sp. HCB288 TaxID=3394355 RepID=UPI0039B4421D